MYKYSRVTAAAVTVVVFNCVSLPVHADGPLDAPPNTSTRGQKGANRRVITSRSRFTAVRGNFSLPSIMKVSSPLSAFSPGLANSKPSFYLGVTRETSLQADAGVQYEWEAIPFVDPTTNLVTFINPGWSVFAYAQFGANSRYETNPIGGWRAGPGTKNEGVQSFDLSWVVRRNSSKNALGTTALPGYYAYLEVTAIGASAQPQHQPTQKEEPGFLNRFVPHTASGGYSATITGATDKMAAKRVICISQGGNYRVTRVNGVVAGSTPAKLNFPFPAGGIYDEDGSYMRGVSFKGVRNGSAGQLAFGDPLAVQVVPPWENWSARNGNPDNPSVDQTLRIYSGTGFYPDGTDKTYIPSPQFGFGSAKDSLPYFSFPSLPSNVPNDSQTSSRYDTETIDINLRRGIPVIGVQVTPGQRKTVQE